MLGRRACLTEITPADPWADYSRLTMHRLQPQALDRREYLSIGVTWVVVADDEQATIYAVPRGMARLRRVRDLEADPKGSEPIAPHVYGFIAELAHYLEEAWLDGRFDELVLVTAEPLLTRLRESLSEPLLQALAGEVPKDLVGTDGDRLQEEVLRVL